MFVDVEIVSVTAVALDSVVTASYIVDVPTDTVLGALANIIFGVVTDIGNDVLADGKTNSFAAVMIDLDFTKVTPLGESRPFW